VCWLHQGASTHLRRSYSPIHGNAAERLPGRAPAAPGRGGRCHGRDIVRRGVGARGEAPRRPLPLPYGSGSRAGRDTFHPWAGAGTWHDVVTSGRGGARPVSCGRGAQCSRRAVCAAGRPPGRRRRGRSDDGLNSASVDMNPGL
jgi:hypothetical protein